ncbi:MAG TPA: peptidylprolyl isomerase [bacterium]|nr:peptidylprolyl isomerase [bacterium]
MRKGFIALLIFVLVAAVSSFAGVATLKDGRILSGQIIVSNDVITIKGNQGFYQIPKTEISDMKLESGDIENAGKSANLKSGEKLPTAVIQTNFGIIKCALLKSAAPETVKNFTTLAKEGFYDNVLFHRVIPNFMIQTGDARFRTKPSSKKYSVKTINDEINAVSLGLDKKIVSANNYQFPSEHLKQFGSKSLKEYYEFLGYKYSNSLQSKIMKRGVLAMANAGPNTNSSQFFITVNDCPWLDGKHTVFGEVLEGYEIAEKISKVQTAAEKPVKDVMILSVQIID